MKIVSGSFQANIHDENYFEKYNKNMTTNIDFIFDAGREKETLNGKWNYSIDPYDTCLRAEWFKEEKYGKNGLQFPLDFDFDNWEKINIPSCINLFKKEYYWYEGPTVFTRKFKFKDKGETRIFLKIGAANYETKVFLNSQYLGFHKGGSTPFYFDITGHLQENNRIMIVVNNTRKSHFIPMTNTDWFNYGGIYRDVELIRLPGIFIKDFSVFLMPDGKFENIKAEVVLSDEKTYGNALFEIKELGIKSKINIKNGRGSIIINAGPELWSPDQPKLYDVSLTYEKDSVSDRIGFREINASGLDIFLNGKKIFLKGISIHEESVINGKAVTEEEIIENFRIIKDLNCNFARLAHYPHTEKASRIADKLGILLWEEIPVYWAIDFENHETYSDAENQLMELIKRDKNRSSVIIWSVGNENPDSDARLKFMKYLAVKAKETDSSRLVTAACLVDRVKLIINDRLIEFLDIIGVNEYYGWYEPDINDLKILFDNSKLNKPVIISEFGADARAGVRGSKNDLWTEDKQLEVYKIQTDVIKNILYIKGITPWILYDFRCPRRTNSFQEFYNRKGLLSEDKKIKKLAYECLKIFYKDL